MENERKNIRKQRKSIINCFFLMSHPENSEKMNNKEEVLSIEGRVMKDKVGFFSLLETSLCLQPFFTKIQPPPPQLLAPSFCLLFVSRLCGGALKPYTVPDPGGDMSQQWRGKQNLIRMTVSRVAIRVLPGIREFIQKLSCNTF